MWWFETEHCKIRFIDEVNAVNIKWFGSPPSQLFRIACNKALELMIEKKAAKFLTDNSNAVVFSVHDQTWLNEEWLPKAKKNGYKASAVLLNPKEGFTKFAVSNIIKKRSTEFISKTFTNEAEAINWLKELNV